MKKIIKQLNQELIQDDVAISTYLKSLGLPSDNVVAPLSERKKIAQMLPDYIAQLPASTKNDARYLSKVVVGAGLGLFDYALNAIWNEVVLAIRKKIIAYGIQYFFDAAVSPQLRSAYQTEDDLSGLKDAVILDQCRKLELIGEIIYLKLKHILDLRNEVGISHPNDYSIKSFELMGWIQTSVEDVINDQPSESAITVKRFIENLKTCTDVLDPVSIQTMTPHIKSIHTNHLANIARTIFGIYCDASTDATVRKNISSIAPIVWAECLDESKYKIGVILEGYNNNLNRKKYELGNQFFDLCGGNRFKSPNERIVQISVLCDQLDDAHDGWNNFYTEVPFAEKISSYFDSETEIPEQLRKELIRVVLRCRIGRGVPYYNGVSPIGLLSYDRILSILGDATIPWVMAALTTESIQQQLTKPICMSHLPTILETVKKRAVGSRIIQGIEYLQKNMPKNPKVIWDTEFKEISKAYLRW